MPLERDDSIGLATLNSSYSHLALSLRYLRESARRAGFGRVWLAEYTTRTPLWKIADDLLRRSPRLLGFSIYIWNREPTLALVELLKKQRPELLVVAGGPEVSFGEQPGPAPALPNVDYLIAGEGEEKWKELLLLARQGREPDPETLRRWATHGEQLPALEHSPFAQEDYDDPELKNRLVYLETSRGCPYSCAFCLSSRDKRVRYFPADLVREDISRLLQAGVRRIKFLDRTFNLGPERFLEWLRWLAGFPGAAFHFEVVSHLLDEKTLAWLKQAPRGMFQFEVGIQSVHEDTGRLISRKGGPGQYESLERLLEADRVHIHADLIWGLPEESPEDIRSSFERVLALRPHELQLGFLKFLPGAPIRSDAERHDYVFSARPPYEVISHRRLSASQVLELKRMEEVFDLYYNSGHFRFTLARLLEIFPPWEFFRALADHFAAEGLLIPSHGLESLLEILADWLDGYGTDRLQRNELLDLLRLDYCHHRRVRRLPELLKLAGAHPPAAVRERRKSGPDVFVAGFTHEITLSGRTAVLTPAPEPVWYEFRYPDGEQGYFFRPRLVPLHPIRDEP
ncbi:MAG: B12-binding domain-containing radical SAM protein [Deltaproteobacteria bacterium]|nr:B12-binding domain-containing radical SAM protein [Deltaproteobacteria bacterium]